MKIYFAGSIRGGRGDQEWHARIIDVLKKFGVVITDHIGNPNLDHFGERGITEPELYRRDMIWLNEADMLVAEVTTPSLGVGHEVAVMEHLGRPVLCLYRPQTDKKLTPMLLGNPSLRIVEYSSIAEASEAISEFMNSLVYGRS